MPRRLVLLFRLNPCVPFSQQTVVLLLIERGLLRLSERTNEEKTMTTKAATTTVLTSKQLAVLFHKACTQETNAQGNQWKHITAYFISEKFNEVSLMPSTSDTGRFDLKPFTKAFKADIATESKTAGTVKNFRKYISTVFNAKQLLIEAGSDGIDFEWEKKPFRMTLNRMFNFKGPGTMPSKDLLNKMIRSQKEGEKPIDTIRRSLKLVEQKIPLVSDQEALELQTLMMTMTTLLYQTTKTPQKDAD
jgi:hypothetical protein